MATRREAIEKLKEAIERHEALRQRVDRGSVRLFGQRQRAASDVIDPVERYVNQMANSPKEFDRSVAEFRIEVNRFSETVRHFETDAARSTKIGSATGAAGAMAGAGVAALGPSESGSAVGLDIPAGTARMPEIKLQCVGVFWKERRPEVKNFQFGTRREAIEAMAIATTFGTASTGTAISTLSGAAATNAALAWLGGGAIAAGGGGMAGGSALLALAGPVGLGIGGVALVGSGLYLNSRNKRYAREATEQRIRVEAEVRSLKAALDEIEGLFERTAEHVKGCLDELTWLRGHAGGDYQRFSHGQKQRLAALINHIRALSELLNREVAL